ncbi:MAG: FG-GAP repeat domain-containing protein, partial [Planctomycetota bacterium]
MAELAAESSLITGARSADGVKTWWGKGGYWMREFRETKAGRRRDYFGPGGAFVYSGRSRACYRPDDPRTRPYFYALDAVATPFPLLPYVRDQRAARGLMLGDAPGYHVLRTARDAHSVRALYLIDKKTGNLVGVRYEEEENEPFASVGFEHHAKKTVAEGARVTLAYGVRFDLRLQFEDERERTIQPRRLQYREKIDTWTVNPETMPKDLRPPRPPAELPNGFTRATFETGADPHDLAVGDLDRDGKMDVAVACMGGLMIHFGGSENRPVRVKLGSSTHAGCAIVDFDLDGRLDVLTMSWLDPSDTLFFVSFDEKREPRTKKVFAAPHFGYGLAVDDFDLDGLPDFVATGFGSRDAMWKFGNGAGGIRLIGTGWRLVKSGRQPERGYGVAVGDFNGDGCRDVAVAEGDRPRIVLFEGYPNLSFHPTEALDETNTGLVRPVDVHVADLNADGKDDLVAAQDHPLRELNGDLTVFLNTGKGFKITGNFAAGDRARSVRSGDIDGDGVLDLVSTSYGTDQLAWLKGHGDGRFDKPRFLGVGRGPTRLAVADMDGDGRLDL